MTGIFITRGMTLSVTPDNFTFSETPEGTVAINLSPSVRFDVAPTWVEIALRHSKDAQAARILRNEAWSKTDEINKAQTLEAEFDASMQAVMAAAIALDGFYAILQPLVGIPKDLIKTWRENRTARYSQIAEVFRRGFNLTPESVSGMRGLLKDIYRLRDLAVHPTGKIEQPIFHPELNVGVEWRFAWFRAQNAEVIVDNATWIMWQLAFVDTPVEKNIETYIKSLRERLSVIFPDGHKFANKGRSKEPPSTI